MDDNNAQRPAPTPAGDEQATAAVAAPAAGAETAGPPSGFGQAVNEYLNGYVEVADTKAALVLGTDLAIAGLLLTNSPTEFWPMIISWVGVVIFCISAVLGGMAVFPRLPSGGNGLIFWEDIATRSTPAEYVSALKPVDSAGVEEAFAHQNFYISKVLKRKYRLLRSATLLFLLAVLYTATSIGMDKICQIGTQTTTPPSATASKKS